MDAKMYELSALAMLNELKEVNEAKEAYKIKAEKLDKIENLITKLSGQYTVKDLKQGEQDFFTNATVQNVLFNIKLIINSEENKMNGNKS